MAFLRALLDKDYIAIDEYGKEIKGNYSGVADGFFQNDRKVVDKWVDQFAQPGERYAQIPHRAYFDASSVFGKATKYFIAWKEIVANVLAESEFFSIVHTLEAELDISSSFLLAANLYYKQAFQVLRAYIENLVLPVYFCEYPSDFSEWKKNNFRVPNMRGEKGILVRLSKKGIISGELSDQISDTYSSLSGYIHGNEMSMAFKGVFEGQWRGFMFKEDDFLKWCNYISHSVDLGVQLLVINLNHWNNKSNGRILCTICHNEELDSREEEFGGRKRLLYYCPRCGNSMRFAQNANS